MGQFRDDPGHSGTVGNPSYNGALSQNLGAKHPLLRCRTASGCTNNQLLPLAYALKAAWLLLALPISIRDGHVIYCMQDSLHGIERFYQAN